MTTKKLARTVIEGGRTRGNTRHPRASNAVERTKVRRVSSALVRGADADFTTYPVRQEVWRQFNDELGRAKRWLWSTL